MPTAKTNRSGDQVSRGSRRRRLPGVLGLPAVLVALLALFATTLAPPAAAQIGDPLSVGFAVVSDLPPAVRVGDTDLSGTIRIVNASGSGVGPVTLEEIRVFPACGDAGIGCSLPDPGVFALSPTGVGRAGTACAGVIFAIVGPEANGSYEFVPSNLVMLAPPNNTNDLDACFIDYTFDVLKAPTIDVSPPSPGLQSGQFAFAQGSALTIINPVGVRRFGNGAGTVLVTVLLANPEIVTSATPLVTLTEPITDIAVVTGPPNGPQVTGTVNFSAFGPDDPTCAGPPAFTETGVPLIPGPPGPPNNATATSVGFTPTEAGTYLWVAVYSGDANNNPVTSPCGAPGETSVVERPVATITTEATSGNIGEPISDTATVTGPAGGPQPTGTVTFTLFDQCGGTAVFTSTNPLVGGVATSDSFTPTAAGDYFWVATYSGDAIFEPVTSPCGAPGETSDILPAQPMLVTLATPAVPLGQPITDTATLSGGAAPTGTITFDLFGPDDPTCAAAPVFTSVVPVAGNGDYTSEPFTPTQPGTYLWRARYSGDANNVALPPGGCGIAGEISRVLGPPLIQVVKEVLDPAVLPEPGGEFTYTVVVTNTGPNDLTITSLTDSVYGDISTQGTCTDAVGTELAADPDDTGPGLGGVYECEFVGTFIGDPGDEETDIVTVVGEDELGTEVDDEDDAIVRIINEIPDISVEKSVTPDELPEPGGDFTFTVVVTNSGIETLTITELTDDIYGNIATMGTCTDAVGTELDPGETYTCEFVGEFLGTAEGPGQTDVVTVVGEDDEGTEVTDEDDATVTLTDVLPTVEVVKTAAPLELPEPGGDFTFDVLVTNTSSETVTITELTDDVYGDLSTQGTCTDAIGTELDPDPDGDGPLVGGTYECEFEGEFIGNADESQTDTVTVVVEDDEENEATDEDDAVVTLTPVAPTVLVVKTATPEVLPAPGGDFTFNVVVTNTSAEDVTITTLTDDIYGNIATMGTCVNAIGTVLAPGGTYSCSFTGRFAGTGGSQTDVVTVVVTDDDDQTATDEDDAVVRITPPPPPPPPPPVGNQNVTRTVAVAPVARVATVLPKTGAGVTDLLALSFGLVAFGGLLVLTASRWVPAAGLASRRRRR